jgi:hypothetical protein
MKIEEVKKYIGENKEKLPLSYNDLVFKTFEILESNSKTTASESNNDADYFICKLYKPISRF